MDRALSDPVGTRAMTFQPASRAASIGARLDAFAFAAEIAPSTRERLLQVAHPKHFPADTVIVRVGEPCQAVPLVERGTVRVARRAERELLLYDVAPGEACVLALTSVLRDTPYPAQATAVAGTDALVLGADEMRSLFDADPAIRRYVVSVFANRLADLMSLAQEVAFDSVEARLARLLLRESEQGDGELTKTHAELAASLGTAREVVSRSLDRFQELGLVELGRRRITVIDVDGVRALLGRSSAT